MSLLSIDDGIFEVLATVGDMCLGGEDLDDRVIDYLIESHKNRTGTGVSQNLGAMGNLKLEVEKAKWALSSQQSTRIEIRSFENDNDFLETLTRSKFEELNIDLFRKTIELIERVLNDAKVKKEDIDQVNIYTTGDQLILIFLMRRSSSSVAPLVFPGYSNSSKNTLVAKSLLGKSTLMRL